MQGYLKTINVRATTNDRARGRLTAGGFAVPCALGPAGIVVDKREGDGASPRGRFAFRRLWRRADKVRRPATGLPVRVTRRSDGWCDAVSHRSYNRLITLPFSASHEEMWRADGLYDLVFELGCNDRPVRQGRGSAIFMHAARPGFSPTAGCVAIEARKLAWLAARICPRTVIRIGSQTPRPRAKRRAASGRKPF